MNLITWKGRARDRPGAHRRCAPWPRRRDIAPARELRRRVMLARWLVASAGWLSTRERLPPGRVVAERGEKSTAEGPARPLVIGKRGSGPGAQSMRRECSRRKPPAWHRIYSGDEARAAPIRWEPMPRAAIRLANPRRGAAFGLVFLRLCCRTCIEAPPFSGAFRPHYSRRFRLAG